MTQVTRAGLGGLLFALAAAAAGACGSSEDANTSSTGAGNAAGVAGAGQGGAGAGNGGAGSGGAGAGQGGAGAGQGGAGQGGAGKGGGGGGGGAAGCPGPNPAGCKQNGCGPGFVCDGTFGCAASACGCDASTGSWGCTADCNGGTCVPADAKPCSASLPCLAGELCDYHPAFPCTSPSAKGYCAKIPSSCPDPGGVPVCGCDGKTYLSECSAWMAGTDVASAGACAKPACETLAYCDCAARTDCTVMAETCFCPCDEMCAGTPGCACGCGGGKYLGCKTK